MNLTVNGMQRYIEASEGTPLVEVLRNDLGFLGVRSGCGIGECGACTVSADGEPLRSCITPIEAVAGALITTPTGLGTPASLHRVQRAFLEERAAQCAYCINGIIMTTACLLEKHPSPADEDIQAALVEHICRCGTHARILRAMRRAAGRPERGTSGVLRRSVVVAPDPRTHWPHPDIQLFPHVEDWLDITGRGEVIAFSGKVEIGQGIIAALARVVAVELDIAPELVDVKRPTTGRSPDQGYTSGSASLERGGTALSMAAAAARRLLIARASKRLGVPISDITWARGSATAVQAGRVAMEELVRETPLKGTILPSDIPTWLAITQGQAMTLGTSGNSRDRAPGPASAAGPCRTDSAEQSGAPSGRPDLIPKLTGAPAFVHDLVFPDMLHARAMLPPDYHSRLKAFAEHSAAAMPGVIAIHQDGDLVLVIADRKSTADRAVSRLQRQSQWEYAGDADVFPNPKNWLDRPAEDELDLQRSGTPRHTPCLHVRKLETTYSKPYEAHAALAPSCAVAWVHSQGTTRKGATSTEGGDSLPANAFSGTLEIWTHSQGIYPLRRELATFLSRKADSIIIHHADGPGCYGHNAADDAAAFAAIAAMRTPGRPVRFQMSVEDEFAWEPYGPAMKAKLEATLNGDDQIATWHHHVHSDVHNTRPNGDGDRLIPSWLIRQRPFAAWPGPAESGYRNATPLYEFANVHVRASFHKGPLRTSALRTLGSYLNSFAIESFMDELAASVKKEPVGFRMAHLSDMRARTVLELAVETAGWDPCCAPSGNGHGVALTRYKGVKAYVAAAVEAAVNADSGAITVGRIICACDAGYVVDEDGLRNQIEGGALQGLSRALHEEVRYGPEGIATRDWTTYPILRFSETPKVEVVLVDGGGPPLGAGEAATPPIPAAVANAIFDASGIRLRELPLTPERLRMRLMSMSDDELAGVIVE